MWKEVEHCLKENPWRLIRPLIWTPDLEDIEGITERLFKLFTTHIWASLNEKWCTKTVLPGSLQEALECWTLRETHRTLTSARYIACNAGLLGSIPGRRVKSFQERLTIYFPKSTQSLTGTWKVLAEPPGYISEYHTACKQLSAMDVDMLHTALELLLSKCQCLPSSQSSHSESGGRTAIWEVRHESVHMLTNPDYYKLAKIGDGRRKTTIRRAPTHTAVKKLQVTLLKQSGVSQDVAKRAVNWSRKLRQRRTGKAKNRRVPPRKVRIQSEEEEGEEEEEEEEEEAEEEKAESESDEVESENMSEDEPLSPEEEEVDDGY
jgi:hypothetical protein